ncbi:hypothetical protein BDR22DRAFT_893266 [Usnea florida]
MYPSAETSTRDAPTLASIDKLSFPVYRLFVTFEVVGLGELHLDEIGSLAKLEDQNLADGFGICFHVVMAFRYCDPDSIFLKNVGRNCKWLATHFFVDAAIQRLFDDDEAADSVQRLLSNGHEPAMEKWARSLEMVIDLLLAAERPTLEHLCRLRFANTLMLTIVWGSRSRLGRAASETRLEKKPGDQSLRR